MSRAQGRGLEANTPFQDERGIQARETRLLERLNESLHEVSQPMTVLLCTLEYGSSLESIEEMQETMVISKEACERLRKTVASLQMQVRLAMEERTAKTQRLV